jgi:hypothetical protein
LPSLPSSLPVYKVQVLASKKAVALQLIRALPLPSTPENEARVDALERMREPSLPKGEPLDLQVGGWMISVWPGGQFKAQNDQWYMNPKLESESAPGEGEARNTAEAFLQRIKPLLAEPISLDSALMASAGKSPDEAHSLGVFYHAEKNGIPLWGGVNIRVGPGPRVIYVASKLRRTVRDRSLPILTANEVIDKLRAGEGPVVGPEWPFTGYVDSVQLGYWQAGTAQDLTYLMPLFRVGGQAVAEGKETARWGASIDAVRPEFLEGSDLERPLHPEPATPAAPEPKKPPIIIRPGEPETRLGR